MRVVGPVLAEQHNEWPVACRDFYAESLSKLTIVDSSNFLPAPALLERSCSQHCRQEPSTQWLLLAGTRPVLLLERYRKSTAMRFHDLF